VSRGAKPAKIFQRAHVVQPVGKFDEHHADVVDHCQDHLADVFRLTFFLTRGHIDLVDLVTPSTMFANLLAELALDVFARASVSSWRRVATRRQLRRCPASSPPAPSLLPADAPSMVAPKRGSARCDVLRE